MHPQVNQSPSDKEHPDDAQNFCLQVKSISKGLGQLSRHPTLTICKLLFLTITTPTTKGFTLYAQP